MTINGTLTGNTNYPESPLSTSVPAAASTTQALEFRSLEVYDNSEIQLVSTSRGATPLLSTIIAIGRQKSGGEFDKIGATELISNNYPEYKFKEQDEQAEIFTCNSTINSSATTLVLLSSAGLIAGLTLRNVTTNEQVRVTSVTNTTTVEIQRAVGTVSAYQIASGDKLMVISTAIETGVATSGTVGVAAQDRSNYFQKFLTTVSLTDYDMLTNKIRDISGADYFMKEKAIVHYRELEKTALFGQKKSGTTVGGVDYYTMEGVIQNAKRGWSHDISSSLTRGNLEEVLGYPLRHLHNGASKKIAICGTKVKAKLSELFEGRLSVSQIENINLKINSIEIDTGEYILISHPFLDENSGYDKHMIVIDPAYIKVVYPQGKDITSAGFNGKTRFVYNKSVETAAYQEGSYITYMTMMNANSNAGGIFKIVA